MDSEQSIESWLAETDRGSSQGDQQKEQNNNHQSSTQYYQTSTTSKTTPPRSYDLEQTIQLLQPSLGAQRAVDAILSGVHSSDNEQSYQRFQRVRKQRHPQRSIIRPDSLKERLIERIFRLEFNSAADENGGNAGGMDYADESRHDTDLKVSNSSHDMLVSPLLRNLDHKLDSYVVTMLNYHRAKLEIHRKRMHRRHDRIVNFWNMQQQTGSHNGRVATGLGIKRGLVSAVEGRSSSSRQRSSSSSAVVNGSLSVKENGGRKSQNGSRKRAARASQRERDLQVDYSEDKASSIESSVEEGNTLSDDDEDDGGLSTDFDSETQSGSRRQSDGAFRVGNGAGKSSGQSKKKGTKKHRVPPVKTIPKFEEPLNLTDDEKKFAKDNRLTPEHYYMLKLQFQASREKYGVFNKTAARRFVRGVDVTRLGRVWEFMCDIGVLQRP
ncbi:hypothetical protein MP228_010070 [Amoeboaphelidium protococcarum]|nr:hypothetical protein MP228_010070 [Amoeboaphelidium protococcarum]